MKKRQTFHSKKIFKFWKNDAALVSIIQCAVVELNCGFCLFSQKTEKNFALKKFYAFVWDDLNFYCVVRWWNLKLFLQLSVSHFASPYCLPMFDKWVHSLSAKKQWKKLFILGSTRLKISRYVKSEIVIAADFRIKTRRRIFLLHKFTFPSSLASLFALYLKHIFFNTCFFHSFSLC